MSTKRDEPKRSSFRSKPWRPFSRKSSKKKKDVVDLEEGKDDIGRRLALASVPTTTGDYTPGPNVFRSDTLEHGRFRTPGSLSESVTSLNVLTAVKETENSASDADRNATEAEGKAKGNDEAVETSEATVCEIRAITEQIVQLQKADEDDESQEDTSDSDGELEGIPRETEEEERPSQVSVFDLRSNRKLGVWSSIMTLLRIFQLYFVIFP